MLTSFPHARILEAVRRGKRANDRILQITHGFQDTMVKKGILHSPGLLHRAQTRTRKKKKGAKGESASHSTLFIFGLLEKKRGPKIILKGMKKKRGLGPLFPPGRKHTREERERVERCELHAHRPSKREKKRREKKPSRIISNSISISRKKKRFRAVAPPSEGGGRGRALFFFPITCHRLWKRKKKKGEEGEKEPTFRLLLDSAGDAGAEKGKKSNSKGVFQADFTGGEKKERGN